MNVELSEKRLDWEMSEAVESYEKGEPVDFTQVNYRIEQLLHGAESCKEMIDNRRKISDNDFYRMLNEFANISDWNDYDCYNVLELAYNMKFIGDAIIKTTMHTIIEKTEGHGRSFDWWDEEVGINFKVLYTENFKVDYEHVYTTEEIKQLIAEKKIVIVSEEERSLAWEENNYKNEDYERFDYAYDNYSMKDEFFNEGGKYYKYTLKYIKKKLNSKKLKELFSKHLEHTEDQVSEAIDGSWYGSDSWTNVAKKYLKEFEDKGYAKRLTKLTENRNRKKINS